MTTVPQVQVTARNYLLSKGTPPISLNGAISLVAVLYRESRLSPASQGYQPTETPGVLNPHGAYGIASWNGPRQQALLDFATKQGLAADLLETQLAFVLNEIANSYPNCWAAIRSAASYQAIIPILVDEYEDPQNKPAEISAALGFAAPLAALPPPKPTVPVQAPQQASQPIPHVTVPTVPAPQAPTPSPADGLPPISATSAGRRAAEQTYIASMVDQLTAERTAIDEEIAAFMQMAAQLGKLNPAPTTQLSLSPVLQPAIGEPAATTIQGIETMFGTSWVTSLFGTGSIAGVLATLAIDIANKQVPDAATMTALGSALSAGIGLIQAKDKNVTGGTVPATPEAKARIGA